MKAKLSNYRQSPRKVRLVTDLVKGKKVSDALIQLSFVPKRASLPVEKLLRSAIANAIVKGFNEANLTVVNIEVNEGVTLKRMMPRARGSSARINKRTSHITMTLGEVDNTSKKPVASKSDVKTKKADKKDSSKKVKSEEK
jgi:large subunit ribosomal protein L22